MSRVHTLLVVLAVLAVLIAAGISLAAPPPQRGPGFFPRLPGSPGNKFILPTLPPTTKDKGKPDPDEQRRRLLLFLLLRQQVLFAQQQALLAQARMAQMYGNSSYMNPYSSYSQTPYSNPYGANYSPMSVNNTNVSSGSSGAGLLTGIVNARGQVDWPLGLQILPPAAETKELRQRAEGLFLAAVQQAGHGRAQPQAVDEASQALSRLRERLRRQRDEMAEGTYNTAVAFLRRLESTLKALRY